MVRSKMLVAAASLFLCTSAAAQQPLKIGFIGELSGPQGALGQDMYDAFMLVVERNGGKLGGVPVSILREDSQLKPEVANQIVGKLIEKDRVPIITGVTFSNIMMAIYKKIVDNEVFLIGSNASPSQIAGAQCNQFYFQAAAQNDQRAEAMGRYAADKGYKRVYAMAPNYQAGKDFIAGFKREYKQALLEEVYTPLNQLDFQAELAQLSTANARRGLRVLSRRPRCPVRPPMAPGGPVRENPAAEQFHHRRHQSSGAAGGSGRHCSRFALGSGFRQSAEQALRRGVREALWPRAVANTPRPPMIRPAARFGAGQGQGQCLR